ncbi:MAG TPA: FAD-dependent oxidoreductase, partial [Acidimicrobiales bacterium]
ALRREEDTAALDLDRRLGVRAEGLDVERREILLAGGARLAYDGLVIATGATPRPLPGQPPLRRVFTLRTLDDSLALRDALAAAHSVVVIGAGFIGLEVAATARGHGAEVTVVEALPAPLIRGLGLEMGGAATLVHGDHGVVIRTGVGVAALEGAEGVERVVLADGTLLPADVVVVGIGVVPNTSWLAGSPLELRDGIVCDETLAAGPPGVYAAGDVARWPHALLGEEVRIEHWTNAAEQGEAAASNLLAHLSGQAGTPFGTVPFFWSDQFEARIQFLGRAQDGDDVQVVHGSPEERRFVALYGRGGRLTAALGVSQPRLVMPYRNLLANRVSWDEAIAFAAGQATRS